MFCLNPYHHPMWFELLSPPGIKTRNAKMSSSADYPQVGSLNGSFNKFLQNIMLPENNRQRRNGMASTLPIPQCGGNSVKILEVTCVRV